MKKLFLIILYAQQIFANNISVVNSTSGQSTMTLQTEIETITQPIFPNDNQYMNDINNPEPTFTIISYKNSPIKKIVITRLSTNTPQIIYYSNEVSDQNKTSSGIYNLNVSGHGILHIFQDHIIINDASYNLTDLSSFVAKCNQLKNNLSSTNIDSTQKEIDDLNTSIQQIQASDMASQFGAQIIIIESAIDAVAHNIKIMAMLNSNLQTVQNLQNHVSDDKANEIEQTLNGLQIGLHTMQAQQSLQDLQNNVPTMTDAGLGASLYAQAAAVKNAMNQLQSSLNQLKRSENSINPEILISNQQEANSEMVINNQQMMNNITYTPGW